MGAIALIGSTAIIIFAIRFLRKGVDRLLGTRPGIITAGFARSPAQGFFVGGLMASVAPSSSSMAMVVSRLSLEERLTPPAALGLMLGANVGLTSLVLFGAAGIETWYSLPLACGILLFQFTHSEISRGIGQVLTSMGFVFLGLHLTKTAIPSLQGGDFDILLGMAGSHPLILGIASGLITILLQSSSITILLLMCVADQHPLGIGAILAGVGGANFGLIGTALAISWKEPKSRLIALANAACKGTVSILALTAALLPLPTTGGDAHTAAGVHLCLAMATAALGLTLGRTLLVYLSHSSLIVNPRSGTEPTTRFIRLEVGGDARLSLANSQREILLASETARSMLGQAWQAWLTGDRALAKEAARLDDRIDLLDREIKNHLARLDDDSDPTAKKERLCQLRYVTQLEAIGDVIEKQIAGPVAKGARIAPEMPAECRLRLETTCQAVHRTLLTAETAFATRDRELAHRLAVASQELNDLVDNERDRSLWRRRIGVTHDIEATYLDLLSGLERINSCACLVGRDILGDINSKPNNRKNNPAETQVDSQEKKENQS